MLQLHPKLQNACISLHNAPRIGTVQFVETLHWPTANVIYVVDEAASNPYDHAVDSKDAKSIVLADVASVHKPGKTWKQRSGILPDHDFVARKTECCVSNDALVYETQPCIDRTRSKKIRLDL